jgi:hypothetical protein
MKVSSTRVTVGIRQQFALRGHGSVQRVEMARQAVPLTHKPGLPHMAMSNPPSASWQLATEIAGALLCMARLQTLTPCTIDR